VILGAGAGTGDGAAGAASARGGWGCPVPITAGSSPPQVPAEPTSGAGWAAGKAHLRGQTLPGVRGRG